MDFKDLNWSAVLSGASQIATVFNPAIGGGLVIASKVVDKLNKDELLSDNDILKNDVIGLTRCSEILAHEIENFEKNGALNVDNLKLVLLSIQSLDVVLDKTFNIMK